MASINLDPDSAQAKDRRKPAYGYLRTSSITNIGYDKDSEPRQRAAIEGFAKAAGYQIMAWYRDPAVSGADPISERPGFSEMLEALVGDGDEVACPALPGVHTIIVESPDRFARDLMVQLTGHDHLKGLGIDLVPASAPDFFLNDTPTAVLVRQVLGAISQFEKTTIVARLKAARDRKKALTGKCEGGKSHAEMNPELVALARQLRRRRAGRKPSLRDVSAALAAQGHLNIHGRPYAAQSISSMLTLTPQGK